jgi:hypothetical protein
MLEKAAGQNCQATNFLKTFSGLPAGKFVMPVEWFKTKVIGSCVA